MKKERKSDGYWTKERCIEDAKNYNSRIQWKKHPQSAYSIACKKGWLDECCLHMEYIHKPNGYWTKERCIEDARQYKTRMEWRRKSLSAYSKAQDEGWLNECYEHMENVGSLSKRLVYVFIFPDRSVYVGLTYNSENRKNEHFFSNRKKKSSVYEHIIKTGLKPKYKELTDYISKDEAVRLEGEYIDRYKKGGYKILNKVKAGGLGGNIRKWTKERCIEDAKQYKTRTEWSKKSKGSYRSAWRNEWLDECCSHMINNKKPHGYWATKEHCIEDARQYKTKSEWREKSHGAYNSAYRNGWLYECYSQNKYIQKPYGYWTKERCIQEAKKYNSRTEWNKKSSSSYEAARRNEWLDLCFPPKNTMKIAA